MSSRQEEKERRRREREAAEQAAAAAQARRKRLGLALAAILGVAALVVIGFVALGGDDEPPTGNGGGSAAIPPQRVDDPDEAARAAGCTNKEHPIEGNGHVPDDTKVDYKTNPPTSGDHSEPPAAAIGIYAQGNPPNLLRSVHALEHGRINFQYKAGTPRNRIEQLETLFQEEVEGRSGFMSLLFENQTGMPSAVAATTWGRSLTCPRWNDRVWDALRTFRQSYAGQGPEQVPHEAG